MSVKIHSANSGELLSNIARQYFGTPQASADLISTNSFLKTRLDNRTLGSDGQPVVISGDAILVITDDNPVIQSSLSGESDQNLTLFLNGKETPIPRESTEIEISFDACVNSFNAVFPWNPYDNKDRDLWNPDNYPEVSIYQGSTQIFGGKVEIGKPEVSPDKSRIDCDARTFTYLLEKSAFPNSAYPLEREKENLSQTTDWACGIFNIKTDDQAPETPQQKKVSCENSTTAWEFLNRISTDAQRVLRSSLDGRKLEIVRAVASTPVAKFTEGIDGFKPPQFNFNTANIHGNHIGRKKSSNSNGRVITAKNEYFEENSYIFHQLDNISQAELKDSLEYQILKSYRDFFTTSFVLPGVLNPQSNKRFKRGDCISINAPSSMVYTDYLFMLQNIKYRIEKERIYTELTVIPPSVYNGEPLESKPWEY